MSIEHPILLIDPATVEVFDRGGGVVTIPYVGRWNSDRNLITTGQTIFDAGTGLALHSHNVEESVLVISGQAMAQIGDTTLEMVAGQASWVGAGVPHRFVNTGSDKLAIYWVYGGRYVNRTLIETGQTFEHLSEGDTSAGRRVE